MRHALAMWLRVNSGRYDVSSDHILTKGICLRDKRPDDCRRLTRDFLERADPSTSSTPSGPDADANLEPFSPNWNVQPFRLCSRFGSLAYKVRRGARPHPIPLDATRPPPKPSPKPFENRTPVKLWV